MLDQRLLGILGVLDQRLLGILCFCFLCIFLYLHVYDVDAREFPGKCTCTM